ncbi:MAG: hypothetical protein MZV65_47375 [Chromatiales bacterium]|nr:hypothetical protein [Chromatiales bacterium]
MMDSNNALFVRGAENFNRDYTAYVQEILNDPRKTKQLNDYLAATPRQTMIQEDLNTFRKLLTKYGVDKHLDQRQRKTAEQLFVQMLDASYSLTQASIARDKAAVGQPVGREPSTEQRRQQDRFNELFKPI